MVAAAGIQLITSEKPALTKLYSGGEVEITRRVRTLVVEPWNDNRFRDQLGGQEWACGTRRARNGAPHARGYTLLQQARGTEACNRIHNRNRLPLKDPAGHRIAQGRIANID